MHRVLLIGDSVRLHYQPVVREELESEAEVIGPAENCETSRKVRARFAVWLESYKPELNSCGNSEPGRGEAHIQSRNPELDSIARCAP